MEAISKMIQVKRVRGLSVVTVAILAGVSLSACASTQYVDQRIAEVNEHVTAVDAKATAADQKADQALGAAQAAQTSAAQANQRIDALTATVTSIQSAPPPRRTPRG
jgi:murein lipoprotein